MDYSWFLLLPTLLLFLFLTKKTKKPTQNPLPPGPPAVPILGNLLWFKRSILNLEPVLRDLVGTHGPIVTLRIGSRLAIFISDPAVTHRALFEHGPAFSSRPTPLPATRFLSCNQHLVSSAPYGPLWRLLRRNLNSEILNPSRIKIYAESRTWVLNILINHLKSQSDYTGGPVVAMESFQFAMFCLLVLMCFGEKLNEKAIREIEVAHRELLVYASSLNVLAFFPSISKYIFKRRWNTAVEMLKRQTAVCMPLIDARRKHKQTRIQGMEDDERYIYSYLDSLLDMKLPDEGNRTLTDDEMVALCAEFINAGTDTTSTGLQWIMAELVIHQDVQSKLAKEIQAMIVEKKTEVLNEEDMQFMPYLKAVVLEGLRLHPPAHFVLPHAMAEEVQDFEGYRIPKNATVNFMVGEMQRDERIWGADAAEFKPERFLQESGGGGKVSMVDLTGSKGIKMMPFGVGRRICPGMGLAILHLEYFVGNLVREFEWKAVEGEAVDMEEKPEFTVVMKNPLRARLVPRGLEITG